MASLVPIWLLLTAHDMSFEPVSEPDSESGNDMDEIEEMEFLEFSESATKQDLTPNIDTSRKERLVWRIR
ncbi:hypothetical protein BSKO_04851 [Bryopsis sp. KO-2023]|nr:hypothetical protein BSKO_04851 [Bryopsis sp. KO-2023]